MKSGLHTFWLRISGSLWFVPGVMVLAAFALALGLVEADERHGLDLAGKWPRVFGADAGGSRELLSALASSMITVAGVVFSVTIVALSLAASAYSPRVLRTFMADRPTQLVLGVFVGVFAYCLVVLRSIHGGDEGFVPRLAVAAAILLALVAIGFLVFFIHHLASAIQAATILDRITAATLRAIDELFPQDLGAPAEEAVTLPPALEAGGWTPLCARRAGYIVSVDSERLLAFAREQERVVRMEQGIGDFVVRGAVLASLAGRGAADEKMEAALDKCYSLSLLRTIEQDAAFGIQEIVDIGVKGLSPGINDPTTAIMCIDRLTEILARIARRRIATPLRSEDGELRVIAVGPTFASLVGLCYDALRNEARGNTHVLMRLVWSLEQVYGAVGDPGRLRTLDAHARSIAECARRTVPGPQEREAIVQRALACVRRRDYVRSLS
jgi:uncharacterized membrane protein